MKVENYINKIIEDTGLTRKEIQDLVNKKKEELKGLISDDGALFIIAKELGVDVKDENKKYLKDIDINISDITLNMKNINLYGRIKEIYSINKFNKNDGTAGYVGSFLLNDHTGDIRIVLWDEHVNIFKQNEFVINEMVKIINGVAKKGRYNDIEIHIGRFSKLILTPDDIDYNEYPKIQFTPKNISDINLNLKSVTIEGKVIQQSSIREFLKKNGDLGKVQSLTLIDSTGSIRISFWDDGIEKLKKIKIDDVISISNLNPKLSTLDSKTIELHANKGSILKKLSEKLQIEGEVVKKIQKLQDIKGLVSFKGIITSIDNLKTVTLKSGKEVSLLGFVISDNTDGIRVTLWREKAEEYSKKLNSGQGILLKNVYVKYNNFSKRNEISLIEDSILELIDLKINDLKEIDSIERDSDQIYSGNYTKIDSINSPGGIEIKGFVAKDINYITIYEACTKCFKKVENCICEMRENTEYRMIINLIIDDGTGTIRTSFIGQKAEKLIGLDTEKILQLKETPDYENFIKKKSSEFLGKDIIIKGKCKFSDYSNSFEISVYDFKDLNVDAELERVMNDIKT